MESKKMKLYLYLARRDKSDVKVLMTFPGVEYPATRIQNIEDLNLPNKVERELTRAIYENRMLWEPWIEGGADYDSLRKSLHGRGYRNVPSFHTPKYIELQNSLTTENSLSLKVPAKTMTRRKSCTESKSSNVSPVNKKTTRINLNKKILPIDIGNDTPILKKFRS